MKKILVANRGEIACRIMRSIDELGMRAIGVHSDADANARHVSLAFESHHIGGSRPADSYLQAERIIEVARKAGADAIHPGYGFLAENADFVENCTQAGLIFVGPDPATIRRMGDKESARRFALALGVPVLQGTEKLDPADADRLISEGRHVGFPLLVKASGGGGGIGLQPVSEEAQLLDVARTTSSLAMRAFGDPAIYLERMVRKARHIEVQLFGLGTDEPVHLGLRECSIQRRYQKIVEEAPPVNIRPGASEGMIAAALNLARACSYRGAGTVEFLYDDDTGDYFFMEMNTRIQVEHPVTEMVMSRDLVALQIRFALGEDVAGDLTQQALMPRGHAIELRVCAENPQKKFLPSPGTIASLTLPELENVRIDTGFCEGDTISSYYDSLVMKLIAWGDDRPAALARARHALAQLKIDGICTNLPFLEALLADESFQQGNVHTKYVEQNLDRLLSRLNA